MSRVEARTVEYFAIEGNTGREMRVPHITPELAEKWTAEGLFIVTRETRTLVPIFGALQTVLPEPQEPRGSNDDEPTELPVLAIKAETPLGQALGLPPGSVGFL